MSTTRDWLASLTPVIRAQQQEEEDYQRYVRQRQMGFKHEKIIRFFKSRNSDQFEAWFRADQILGDR